MSPIEKFAEQELGITLTPVQCSIIKTWSERPRYILQPLRREVSTAQKVIRAYIAANIKGAKLV